MFIIILISLFVCFIQSGDARALYKIVTEQKEKNSGLHDEKTKLEAEIKLKDWQLFKLNYEKEKKLKAIPANSENLNEDNRPSREKASDDFTKPP